MNARFLSICAVVALANIAAPSTVAAADKISVGVEDACAIVGSQLFCWGYNQFGQVGASTDGIVSRPRIVQPVEPGAQWTDVAEGGWHTCALSQASGHQSLFCWGLNNGGQLGDGTTVDSPSPSLVLDAHTKHPLANVTAISVGGVGTCAVADDKIACWGYNGDGELGDNSTSDSAVPVVLENPGDIGQIAGGNLSNCAISNASALYCWGWNYFGQVGDGTTTTAVLPQQILRHAYRVSSSGRSTCALADWGPDRDRLLKCWGDNRNGELGDGTGMISSVPVTVLDPSGFGPLTGVIDLSLGYAHSCALTSDAHVYCWGSNYFGMLGDGTGVDSLKPVAVSNPQGDGPLTNVVGISAGENETCAIQSNSTILCWGRNERTLGDGTSIDRNLPVVIDLDEIFSSEFEMQS